ncbi:hypothetical protein IFM53868_09869 [Aspergillus udagawae]|uniref:Uncharacterized protein n=1 Tax=Aspergillus udagawae TaxID=91492 RepID=A0ABQ1BCM8_9EURO|nr:hypothetical protein IFM53868_09869 [Aspergillus udagawae]
MPAESALQIGTSTGGIMGITLGHSKRHIRVDAPIHTTLVREASAHLVQAILCAVFICPDRHISCNPSDLYSDGKASSSGKQWKLPPGPPGLPILRNLLDLKSAPSDPDFEWVNSLTKYGEMTTVHLGSKIWIFVNSQRVVSEIIARRGSITNGRSPVTAASRIISRHGRSLILLPAGWAEKRRVMHSLLSGTALRKYGAWQEASREEVLEESKYRP